MCVSIIPFLPEEESTPRVEKHCCQSARRRLKGVGLFAQLSWPTSKEKWSVVVAAVKVTTDSGALSCFVCTISMSNLPVLNYSSEPSIALMWILRCHL